MLTCESLIEMRNLISFAGLGKVDSANLFDHAEEQAAEIIALHETLETFDRNRKQLEAALAAKDKVIEGLREQKSKSEDYAIALQRAIERHCHGEIITPAISIYCPHHAAMLNAAIAAARMGTMLNRKAYEELIAEDLEWLLAQPRTLERDHIEIVLHESANRIYGESGIRPKPGDPRIGPCL